ncbi:hypothetical protein [Bacillus wiedmannii]|nr:hypothetical protein [Bacillus wiedmannii]
MKKLSEMSITELEFELWRLKQAPWDLMDHDRMGEIATEIKERAYSEIE